MTKRVLFSACLSVLTLFVAAPTFAQQEGATPAADDEVAVTGSSAQAFLGYWMLQAKLGERDVKMGLHFQGRRGFEAHLVSFFGELEGENFRHQGKGLVFDVVSGFGEFLIEAKTEGEKLLGSLASADGAFTAEFVGTKSDRVAYQLFLIPDNETRITRDEEMLRLRFAMPPKDERDFQQISSLEPGQVLRFPEDPVMKLTTDFPLRVGALEVPVANVTADYPGVYGLWLKRTEAGWSLVFNHKPDVWGTQYDAEKDLGEVPLTLGQASEPSETLVAKLEEKESGSVLSLTWGQHRWTTPFEILEASP